MNGPAHLIRDFVRQAVEGRTTFETHALIKEVSDEVETLLDDSDFVRGILHDAIQNAIREVMKERRMYRTESGATSRDDLDFNAKRIAARMFEPVGHTTRKVVLRMTRPDLLYAANLRRQQANGHLRRAEFEERLAELMPNDTVTVDQQFGEQQFNSLWEEFFD